MSNQSSLSDFDVLDTGETERDPVEDKLYRDEEWLREQYHGNGLSQAEIADKAGVSQSTVEYWIRKTEIETRSAGRPADGNIEPLKDEEWLREQYCEQEKTMKEIADEVNSNDVTVANYMERYGIDSRSTAESRTDGDLSQLENAEWLRQQYCELEKTTREIGDELDLSRSTVERAMKEHGIEFRSPTEARTDGDVEPLENEEWLRDQYCEQEKTMKQIADGCGVSLGLVRDRMQEHDIKRRSLSEAKADGDIKQLEDEEWLRQQYCKRGKSTIEIADELSLSKTTISNRMREHGIKHRSTAESRTDGDLEQLEDEEWLRQQYCELEKTTYRIADELDLSRHTVTNRLNQYDIEIRGGYMDPDHLPHSVASEWELEIANRLHYGGINYEYESEADEIEYGEDYTYKPDFSTDDYVIECKGTDWGRRFSKGHTAEQKAEAAMSQLDEREYVVVGHELPSDIHIPREEHDTILERLEHLPND